MLQIIFQIVGFVILGLFLIGFFSALIEIIKK